ncbi:retention module-containing protein [Paraglaciecola polaris]|uniref:RTX toxin, putative n=1 Tax=Paraglaciecola polaris LMG 21857 TaxID=1129793 RepID=K7A6Q3_9ALTE|nr:retention module-containing protein [Paraglaciecola polaris]GAC31135.1 RTX toxin, putative [Paraglaciecola polaris LMG 21857]
MAELEYTVERIEGDDSITVISENGDIRFASVGEVINAGDTILSFEGGQVVLTAGGQNIVIDNSVDVFITADLASQQGNQDDEAEEINVDDDFLAALDGDGDLLDSLESTAAGSDSSGQDTDGSSFVRVERISEDVDPVAFEYAQTGNDSVQLETQEVSAADFDIEFDLGSVINEVTPTFVGTTSAPAGSAVDVLITDQNGTTQNVTSVVQDDGTFTVNVGNALPEGTFTVEASITDNAGNTTTVSVSSSVDITAPIIADLTVEAGNNTPAISGSTDAEPGTAVVVTLIDGNGDSQLLNSVVQGDGSFSAIPESPLVDGDFTLVAQVTDNAGNTTSATITGNVDTTAPVVTDTTTTDNNSDTPTFTGTTNAEPGSAVTMTVTDANGDSQVMNAVVQEDGVIQLAQRTR